MSQNNSMMSRAGGLVLDALVAQIQEASSIPQKELLLLPSCRLCGLVRDDPGPFGDGETWVTLQTFEETHRIDHAECLLMSTHCPACFTTIMERRTAAHVIESMRTAAAL